MVVQIDETDAYDGPKLSSTTPGSKWELLSDMLKWFKPEYGSLCSAAQGHCGAERPGTSDK